MIQKISTSVALPERGQEVTGETPVTRLCRGSKVVAVHNPILAALPRFEAPTSTAARVGALRRSQRARGIDHEIEISRAVLKLGACRIEAIDDATFQNHSTERSCGLCYTAGGLAAFR